MKLLRGATTFAGVLLPSVMIAMLVVIVLADVIARNFFASSIHWAQELAVILLAASVWLGLAGASMQGQLFGISFFVDRLPPRAAAVTRAISDILVMLIAGAVIHAAWAQITTARFTKFLALGWPKWIMAALLACGMALVILVRLIELIQSRKESRP